MSTHKEVFVVFCVFCLSFIIFSTLAVNSTQTSRQYNPWLDTNDDGKIFIDDVARVAKEFGTAGTPLTKSLLLYDSNWLNITDKAGQDVIVSHDLNISDWNDSSIMVEITGKTTLNGGLLRYLGFNTPQSEGWTKTYGGPGYEEAHFGIQTSDGGYMLVGDTNSGAGGYDFYVVKTDSDGNVQWSNTYGGPGWDRAYGGVVQTSDGGYAIDGYTSSYGAGSYDFWLIKIDANGKMVWNKTYGGTGQDIAEWIIQTNDGGFALSGKTTSFGAGGLDVWLVKTDSDGNMQWNKTYGGPNDDVPSRVIQTSDGGYLISARTESFGAGGRDFWVIKTDQLGNMEWNKTYGGPNDEGQCCVSLTSDGGYAIVGGTYSFGAGGSDGWFIKTDANGNIQWNKTYGGPLDDSLGPALQTADGGYFLLGTTYSFGAGGQDIWLIKTDQFGNMEWNKTFGGPNDEYTEGLLIATTDGGLAITGWTSSFGAGAEDMYLIKTSVNPPASNSGLAWIDSSPNTITLHRASGDSLWNYVRVRIAQVS